MDLFGDAERGQEFLDSVRGGKFLLSLVISYTETCEIPGITVAGASRDMMQLTPPCDAEYLHYGYCKTNDTIPMTPDGKPTPGLLTKIALESASIPHMIVNAGSKVTPQMPFVETGMSHGRNISTHDAMTYSMVTHAVDYGRIVGRTMASLTDCLVIGESIPGGTTTALAVLRALGFDARVSSSMPDNPGALKGRIASIALGRVDSEHPYSIVAKVGDPMIPFVAGMLSAASETSKIILAGGTQMAAVLAFASKIGFNNDNALIGTTSYITDDKSANFVSMIDSIADIPIVAVDPGLAASKHSGLRAFSEGFAKEGVGAGGCITASMLKSGNGPTKFLEMVDKEYHRLFTTLP